MALANMQHDAMSGIRGDSTLRSKVKRLDEIRSIVTSALAGSQFPVSDRAAATGLLVGAAVFAVLLGLNLWGATNIHPLTLFVLASSAAIPAAGYMQLFGATLAQRLTHLLAGYDPVDVNAFHSLQQDIQERGLIDFERAAQWIDFESEAIKSAAASHPPCRARTPEHNQ